MRGRERGNHTKCQDSAWRRGHRVHRAATYRAKTSLRKRWSSAQGSWAYSSRCWLPINGPILKRWAEKKTKPMGMIQESARVSSSLPSGSSTRMDRSTWLKKGLVFDWMMLICSSSTWPGSNSSCSSWLGSSRSISSSLASMFHLERVRSTRHRKATSRIVF